MTADALLDELASIFDHRPSRMELRRKFEERVWRSNENFSDNYQEKLISANSVSVLKEDLIDYLIDGIPNLLIRNQARIQCFKETTKLLEAFEKVTLKCDKKRI